MPCMCGDSECPSCGEAQGTRENFDFYIQDHGSVVLVIPTYESAAEALRDLVDGEAQWWAGGLVVEPRYLDEFIQSALIGNGWTVKGIAP